MNYTIAGIDLAKDAIQVCIYKNQKVQTNEEMTPIQFSSWLTMSKPLTIVFESCSTSNYWKQVALERGHDAHLISAKLVANIRQHQKTDKNDALAVIQAAQLPNIKFISGKTFQQQELQAMMRFRELAVKQKVSLTNQITGLLLEFNIRVSPRNGGLNGAVQEVLENAGNGFSMLLRDALNTAWQQLLQVIISIKKHDANLEKAVQQEPDCSKLMALEGVKTINAIHLYNVLACSDMNIFQNGRDAAACIGVTPVQHSSGGKIKLGSIGKYVKNTSVRSCLISGAMSAVCQAVGKKARTKKELWIQELVARRGKSRAAVALANKTVRTAYAMLNNGTEYKAELLVS